MEKQDESILAAAHKQRIGSGTGIVCHSPGILFTHLSQQAQKDVASGAHGLTDQGAALRRCGTGRLRESQTRCAQSLAERPSLGPGSAWSWRCALRIHIDAACRQCCRCGPQCPGGCCPCCHWICTPDFLLDFRKKEGDCRCTPGVPAWSLRSNLSARTAVIGSTVH